MDNTLFFGILLSIVSIMLLFVKPEHKEPVKKIRSNDRGFLKPGSSIFKEMEEKEQQEMQRKRARVYEKVELTIEASTQEHMLKQTLNEYELYLIVQYQELMEGLKNSQLKTA